MAGIAGATGASIAQGLRPLPSSRSGSLHSTASYATAAQMEGLAPPRCRHARRALLWSERGMLSGLSARLGSGGGARSSRWRATSRQASAARTRPPPKTAPLFTPEDSWRLHALLGFACFGHGLWRIGMLLCGVPDMGFRGDALTAVCLGGHAALSASSFRFRVPRSKSRSGTQIWREYREHNAVFTARALAGCLAAWLEDRYHMGHLWWLRVGALFAQLLIADAVSKKYKLPTTTLGAVASPRVRRFLAMFQFFATANLLFGRGFWQQFCVVFAIQVTAFFMTLNRRRILSPRLVVVFYAGLLLAVNQLVMAELYAKRDVTVLAWGTAACILRLGLRWNKYIVWSAVLSGSLLCRYV